MSNNTNWLRKTAFVGLGSALALGTALGTAGSASAEIRGDSFTVTPVAAGAGVQNVNLNDLVFTENEDDDFVTPGLNTFTVTLDNGAVFEDDTILNGDAEVEINGGGTTATAGPITLSAPNQITFSVTGSPAEINDTIVVSGLQVDTGPTAGDVDATVAKTAGGPINGGDAIDADDDDLSETVITSGIADNIEVFNRIGGPDRYATAAEAFDDNGTNTAVIAGGQDFPDALSASGLAARADGGTGTGVLLTKSGSLPDQTRQALIDNSVTRVYIVGGTAAVSKAVENQVRALTIAAGQNGADTTPNVNVIRFSGENRYGTNLAVNTAQDNGFLAPRIQPDPANRVLVASGEGFADAVAFGSVAYGQNLPLILTPSATLGAQARQQIELFTPGQVDIAGGTASVSAAAATAIDEAAVNAAPADIERHGGAERTATAVQIQTWAAEEFNLPVLDETVIVNGSSFADALSASAVSAQLGTTTLLAQNSNAVGPGLTRYLNSITEDSIDLTVFGLTAVTPQALISKIAAALDD